VVRSQGGALMATLEEEHYTDAKVARRVMAAAVLRAESAEATLAAVRGRIESLAQWLNAPGRYVTAERAAELVCGLIDASSATPAPQPAVPEPTPCVDNDEWMPAPRHPDSALLDRIAKHTGAVYEQRITPEQFATAVVDELRTRGAGHDKGCDRVFGTCTLAELRTMLAFLRRLTVRAPWWPLVVAYLLALLVSALTACSGFSAGPIACRFEGEYLITLYATTPGCEDLEQRRKFGGTFAFGCSPSLGLPGYTGTVECTDDSDNIAFACVGQLQGKGCEYELVVERVTP
jgi:hypothetical protein